MIRAVRASVRPATRWRRVVSRASAGVSTGRVAARHDGQNAGIAFSVSWHRTLRGGQDACAALGSEGSSGCRASSSCTSLVTRRFVVAKSHPSQLSPGAAMPEGWCSVCSSFRERTQRHRADGTTGLFHGLEQDRPPPGGGRDRRLNAGVPILISHRSADECRPPRWSPARHRRGWASCPCASRRRRRS
jgi:hypothetical protein